MPNNKPKKSGTNLETQMVLKFHTNYAINLIDGTKKTNAFIPGLISFSSKFKIIKNDYDNDIELAKEYHDEILNKFSVVSELVKTLNSEHESIFKSYLSNGIEITLAINENAETKTFKFATPFCYRIAILISQYDLLVRRLTSLVNIGEYTKKDLNKTIERVSKQFRILFHSTEKYTNKTTIAIVEKAT